MFEFQSLSQMRAMDGASRPDLQKTESLISFSFVRGACALLQRGTHFAVARVVMILEGPQKKTKTRMRLERGAALLAVVLLAGACARAGEDDGANVSPESGTFLSSEAGPEGVADGGFRDAGVDGAPLRDAAKEVAFADAIAATPDDDGARAATVDGGAPSPDTRDGLAVADASADEEAADAGDTLDDAGTDASLVDAGTDASLVDDSRSAGTGDEGSSPPPPDAGRSTCEVSSCSNLCVPYFVQCCRSDDTCGCALLFPRGPCN